MENGAFALYFQKYSKKTLSFIDFLCFLKIVNDAMIKNSLWSNG